MGHESVANVLLSLSLKGGLEGGAAAAVRAAAEVARSSARALLLPLLDRLIARLAAVLLRTWCIAVDHVAPQGALQRCWPGRLELSPGRLPASDCRRCPQACSLG